MIRSVAFSWVYMNRVWYDKTLNREITRQSTEQDGFGLGFDF